MIDILLKKLGIPENCYQQGTLNVYSPIDGQKLATLPCTDTEALNLSIERAMEAFKLWRQVPAPKRGQLVRILGEILREYKSDLAELISVETGKIIEEGLGEVQEMIDICDFAVGLSRQLYGLTIVSERPGHHMRETWHPLGVVGIISAFNFPVAVWSWNAAIALVCGNSLLWKPSEKTPLCALACQALLNKAIAEFGNEAPQNVSQVVIGDTLCGSAIVNDKRVALISATGSTIMGKTIGPQVAERFGRSILELGGNNAMIVTPSADLSLALKAILFSAVGTAGQRCTSLRRLIIHESIRENVIAQLKVDYESISIGNPMKGYMLGPLIDQNSFDNMQNTLLKAKEAGGMVFGGNRILQEKYPNAYYVKPAIVEMPTQNKIVKIETFAPILYVLSYQDLSEAISLQNNVPQGLSSCIFTNDIREAEYFVSSLGSDCGIANINIGPSGAEIGGAFGGEKETGGGRESGSDAWKNYMRRQTSTVNYSKNLPLAQNVHFGHSK